jgi:hypothetical protein
VCFGWAATSLEELVRVAGARWAIEAGFEAAKGEVGLADYQVRGYPAWYRHVTLALLAHAYLAVTRARAAAPDTPDLLPLTVPEVRRLLCRLVWAPAAPAEQVLAWSRWRRRHQARARRCHYRRRLRRAST